MSPSVLSKFVCVGLAVIGLASSVPAQQPPVGPAAAGGYSAIMWSVWDDCFGGAEDFTESPAVCIKYKALTALNRALSKPTLAIADGVSLTARTGKSMQSFDAQQTNRTDQAALDAAKDPDHKSALLDDLLASRMDALVSSRTIVMDSPADQEGRGKKKKDKTMKKAMMMMGMMMAAVMGPMMMKIIAMIAIKALIVGKIALLLSGIMLVKKLMMMPKKEESSHHEPEPESHGGYDRRMQQFNAQNMAYSGQEQSFAP